MGKKGLTLVELLLTVAILAVAAGLMFALFGQGLSLYTIGTKSADEQQSLRQVLSDITNSARLAGAGIDADGNVLTIGDNVYSHSGENVFKNEAVIADKIVSFQVSIDSAKSLLNITIKNTKGAQMQTSLTLAK